MLQFIKRMININNNYHKGKSITIINGKVYIDGKDVTPDAKEINISVEGNIENLEVDHANAISIKGDINKVKSGSGDISCGNITGGAQTGSGDIDCGVINGDVQTGSGDVNATTISGSVRTGSGDIKYKGK
jgi:hypothetical protein